MMVTIQRTHGQSVLYAFDTLAGSAGQDGSADGTGSAARFACPSGVAVDRAGSLTIPWSEIGAKAGTDYQGDGLSVTATKPGAQLHCVFQRLEGEATSEGLWLTSTVTHGVKDRFRVTASAVGRHENALETSQGFGVRQSSGALGSGLDACDPVVELGAADRKAAEDCRTPGRWRAHAKPFPSGSGGGKETPPATGTVEVVGKLARLIRPGLVEEYSVSMDGVRQDFLITQRPDGTGELQVRLDVAGARVEPAACTAGAAPSAAAVPKHSLTRRGLIRCAGSIFPIIRCLRRASRPSPRVGNSRS